MRHRDEQPDPRAGHAGDDVPTTDLHRRVAELEAANEQLTEALEAAPPRTRKRWRSLLAAVLIVLWPAY